MTKSSGSSAQRQGVLDAERSINEQYAREMRKLIEAEPHLLRQIAVVRSQQWTDTQPRSLIGHNVSTVIGRVVLEPDHPYSDVLGESFYIAGWRIETDEFETVNWAAPAAALFFEGQASNFEIASSVEGRRTFVVRRDDLVDYHDDIEAHIDLDPFARGVRTLEIPAPPSSRVGTPKPASEELTSPETPAVEPELAGKDVAGLEPEPVAGARPVEPARFGLRAESAVFKVMEMPKTGRMGPVLPTMQPDQYHLVSWPADSPLVVQGQPGTGKTVIAAHRAAYLTSREREEQRIARIALIGPSDHYIEHINPILTEVKEREANIHLLSLPDWFQQVVGLRAAPQPGRAEWLETSWELGGTLERFVRMMTDRPEGRRMEPRVHAVVDRIRKATPREVTNEEHRAWLAALPPWTVLSSQAQYLPMLATIALALDSSAAGVSGVGHLIVDEAQDIRPIEWRILTSSVLEVGGGISLFGDINQRRSDWTQPDWERLAVDLEITDDDGHIQVHELENGYRSTRQILKFANQLLPRGTRGERALRDGPDPRVVRVQRGDRTSVCVQEANALATRHAGLVALISNEPRAVSNEFRRRGWSRGRWQHSWMKDGQTIVILHPDQARGLEFDGVVVEEPADYPENVGRQGVLYTSLTRANKELTVVHVSPLPKELRVR